MCMLVAHVFGRCVYLFPCFPDMDCLDCILILLAKLEKHSKAHGNYNMGNVQRKVKGSAECPVGSLRKELGQH